MFALTLLLLTQAASAFSSPTNHSFESGDFSSWSHWGAGTIVSTDGAYDGSYAAQLSLDPSSTGSQEYGLYQDVPGISAGEHVQFTILASMSVANPLTAGATLRIKWEAYNGPTYQGASETIVPLPVDGSFGYGKVELTVPADNTLLRYTLLIEGPQAGAGGTVYVDYAQISPYMDDWCPEILDQPLDADGDQVGDDCDVCVGDDTSGDADADTICDNLDVCLGDDSVGDADGDGVCDDQDLCDGDDATGDADGDGLCADSDPDDAGDTDLGADTDVTGADTDLSSADTDDGSTGDAGCGCAQPGSPIALAPLALLALAARRRRRD
jgi:MYXO-CTERM domain-containing protein